MHDSDILDPIEKAALTQIVKEYNTHKKIGKQVFTSFRSLDFYEPEAQVIMSCLDGLETRKRIKMMKMNNLEKKSKFSYKRLWK